MEELNEKVREAVERAARESAQANWTVRFKQRAAMDELARAMRELDAEFRMRERELQSRDGEAKELEREMELLEREMERAARAIERQIVVEKAAPQSPEPPAAPELAGGRGD